jgi:hypothetical protein
MVNLQLAIMAVLAAVAVTVSAQGQVSTDLPACAVSCCRHGPIPTAFPLAVPQESIN